MYVGHMESSRIEAIPFFADLPEDELAAVAGVGDSRVCLPARPACAAGGGGGRLALSLGGCDLADATDRVFKRDVWARDRRAPVATQRLRAMVDERRMQDAQRALAKHRPQDE
jgi:hypothetical protein